MFLFRFEEVAPHVTWQKPVIKACFVRLATLPRPPAAAGLAAIGAIANLIGGAVMVNAYGIINERTGSYTLAMLPLAALCVAGGIAVLIMGRQARNAQLHEKQVTH